jgi:hypothetical protein
MDEGFYLIVRELLHHLSGVRFARDGDRVAVQIDMDPGTGSVMDDWRDEFFPELGRDGHG